MFWRVNTFLFTGKTCLKFFRSVGTENLYKSDWTRTYFFITKNMLGIKRRPPALQPDDRKRLRMVCAEPAVGRGRRTSVSTSSFQDAMELIGEQQARFGRFTQKTQHKRAKYPWEHVRLFGRKPSTNTLMLQSQQSNSLKNWKQATRTSRKGNKVITIYLS